jgi:hypothetical protein
MNAIMSRKLRGKQDSDKSLHNFTQRRFDRLRKKHFLRRGLTAAAIKPELKTCQLSQR